MNSDAKFSAVASLALSTTTLDQASSMSQLEQNLAASSAVQGSGKEGLPDEVLQALDAAWMGCKADAFAFWRGYSIDQPGREEMDQGASYSVKKK